MVHQCQKVSVAFGDRERSDKINMDDVEALRGWITVCQGSVDMPRDFRALALVAGFAQFSNFLLHPLPHETFADQFDGWEWALVRQTMEKRETHRMKRCWYKRPWPAERGVAQNYLSTVSHGYLLDDEICGLRDELSQIRTISLLGGELLVVNGRHVNHRGDRKDS